MANSAVIIAKLIQRDWLIFIVVPCCKSTFVAN